MLDLPTGTVTLLFTDIEGATALLRRLGSRYVEVIAEHHRLLRETFDRWGGHEAGLRGDGFIVAFPRAREAVEAAVAMQRAILGHPWPEGVRLRVRMGLHTGEPHLAASGYVGLVVHRAARICAAGHGGQILVSETTQELVAHDLPRGASFKDLGQFSLKDLTPPEHLFQLIVADLPVDFPPLHALGVRSNNLPRHLTNFIGRGKELAEVKRLLATAHLVTLTGAGGVGKTRLALHVAAEIVEDYRDGVWLAEFATLTDPALVPKTLASALNVPEQPGRDITETVIDALQPNDTLLIFDNCEHVLAACQELATRLFDRCPQVRILATSRERLGFPGEAIWRVPSLSVPDARDHLLTADIELHDATRLFVDRALENNPGFAVNGENARSVAQVCQRLDGIPLAIELAAARVKVLTVEKIAARLDDRFRLLTGGSQTLLPRHRTLRATMDWSYDLLTAKERAVLRRISVFAGGCTLEAAEAICAGKGVEPSDVLDLLTALVDKSLVLVEAQGSVTRYRLLETVRQYGMDQLEQSGESAEVRRRHRDWYLDLAERTEEKLYGSEGRLWEDRLETEHDNLRAALEWSRTEIGGTEAGLRLAGALTFFWSHHTHWSEGQRRLEEALARRAEAPKSVLPKALMGATMLNWWVGNDERATTLGESGLALCDDLGDKRNRAWLLLLRGLLAIRKNDHAHGTTLFEQGLVLSRDLGDAYLTGMILGNLGVAARNQRDYRRAVAFHAESLEVLRRLGGAYGIAYGLLNLGKDTLRQNDNERASAYFAEGLSLCRGKYWLTHDCIEGLAAVAHARRDDVRAARLFSAASLLRHVIGHRRTAVDQADYEDRIGFVRTALGDAAFEAAWGEGRAMTLGQAIEYALAEEPDVATR